MALHHHLAVGNSATFTTFRYLADRIHEILEAFQLVSF